MTKTKTITKTEEVEAVECSSCGQDIEKDKAYKFVIHTETNNKRFDDNHPNQYRDGWACQYCADESPAAYPSSSESTTGKITGNITDWLMSHHIPILFLIVYGGCLILLFVFTEVIG